MAIQRTQKTAAGAAMPSPKPRIMEITPYSPGKSKAGGGGKVIKLASNESALGPSPKAIAAYQAEAGMLHRYPNPGHRPLREAIEEAHGVPADRIVCGAGSDELIHLLLQTYVGAGDEVLYSEHGFLMYQIGALACGAAPVTAPEKNLRTDVDALLARVTPRTKVVFVANPNNPTGSYITRAEMKRLHAGLPGHALLVVDGAYAEYVTEEDYSDGSELAAETENTVMLRTFSKIYGLPALRLGWAYAPEAVIDALNRIRGPFNVSSPAQAAGIAAVKDAQYTRRVRDYTISQREWLAERLRALGLKVHPSVANFMLVEFPQEKGRNASAVNDFLMGRGIIPREVGNYGLPQCLRITVGLEEENRALIDALQALGNKDS